MLHGNKTNEDTSGNGAIETNGQAVGKSAKTNRPFVKLFRRFILAKGRFGKFFRRFGKRVGKFAYLCRFK